MADHRSLARQMHQAFRFEDDGVEVAPTSTGSSTGGPLMQFEAVFEGQRKNLRLVLG